MKLIFATGNEGKVREAQQIFDALEPVYGVHVEVLPMPLKVDIEENGTSYRENSLIKARYVHSRWGCDCFADDSGLEVEALDGAPGIYTARYCDHNFSDGIDLLLHTLGERGATEPSARRASFKCCISLILDGEEFTFEGDCPGTISGERCGSAGFGFDPVFIADATPGLCMAELPEEKKNSISHRGSALEKMMKFLSSK